MMKSLKTSTNYDVILNLKLSTKEDECLDNEQITPDDSMTHLESFPFGVSQ